jgi:hypothetical protein
MLTLIGSILSRSGPTLPIIVCLRLIINFFLNLKLLDSAGFSSWTMNPSSAMASKPSSRRKYRDASIPKPHGKIVEADGRQRGDHQPEAGVAVVVVQGRLPVLLSHRSLEPGGAADFPSTALKPCLSAQALCWRLMFKVAVCVCL